MCVKMSRLHLNVLKLQLLKFTANNSVNYPSAQIIPSCMKATPEDNLLFISELHYNFCFVCTSWKKTHFDASSRSVALMLWPCPSLKLVSLPTTTTPSFMVPKAGRQRRVTAEGGDRLSKQMLAERLRKARTGVSLTGFTGHQHGRTQAVSQELGRTLKTHQTAFSVLFKALFFILIHILWYHFECERNTTSSAHYIPVQQSPLPLCRTACSNRARPCLTWLSPASYTCLDIFPRTAATHKRQHTVLTISR